VLNLNNIRDIESDKESGKFSIPVRLGIQNAKTYHYGMLIAGMLATLCYLLFSAEAWPAFLSLLAFIPFSVNILMLNKRSGREIDPLLKQLALSTLLFAILFAAGQAFGGFA
jgi:1,4-dihydroxy-2-naphthoate octaprenyltransferase